MTSADSTTTDHTGNSHRIVNTEWGAPMLDQIKDISMLRADLELTTNTQHTTEQNLSEEADRWRKWMAQREEKMLQEEEELDGMTDHLVEIKRNIRELQASIAHLSASREMLSSKITTATQSTKPSSTDGGGGGGGGVDATSSTNSTTSDRLAQMCATVQLFERLFGICVLRTHSNSIQIRFRGCSGSAASEIISSCQIRYTAVGRFEAVKCNPPIPDFERLVKHLNLTNDLRSFVILIRRRFCQYFELASAVSQLVPP